jgi:hypothetical protein
MLLESYADAALARAGYSVRCLQSQAEGIDGCTDVGAYLHNPCRTQLRRQPMDWKTKNIGILTLFGATVKSTSPTREAPPPQSVPR